jgi:hypothetical protein
MIGDWRALRAAPPNSADGDEANPQSSNPQSTITKSAIGNMQSSIDDSQ